LKEERCQATIDRWEAERESKPTDLELELWERTVADLRVRYKLEEDKGGRSELCTRLATANIKMEKYGEALVWADLGLAEGEVDRKAQLQELKASALFLDGKEDDAKALLESIEPPEEHPPTPRLKRTELTATEDATLNLRCPECSTEVAYGQLRCPSCGAKVDERFKMVRSTTAGSREEPNLVPHRVKRLSIFLTEYEIDYDDPINFLTAHRVRFMGGESITCTERSWYVWMSLLVQMVFYVFWGALLWKASSLSDPPPGVLVVLVFLMLISLGPLTLFYLYIVFPNFMGDVATEYVEEG